MLSSKVILSAESRTPSSEEIINSVPSLITCSISSKTISDVIRIASLLACVLTISPGTKTISGIPPSLFSVGPCPSSLEQEIFKEINPIRIISVSYTHLTLPTICSV